jgi:hypothetical protein
VEALVVRMARENAGWGYDRIVGALTNLSHHLSGRTVGNILRRRGIAGPEAKPNDLMEGLYFRAWMFLLRYGSNELGLSSEEIQDVLDDRHRLSCTLGLPACQRRVGTDPLPYFICSLKATM